MKGWKPCHLFGYMEKYRKLWILSGKDEALARDVGIA